MSTAPHAMTLALLPLVALTAGATPCAQEPAFGAESRAGFARSAAAGGGVGGSSSFSAEVAVGGTLGTAQASSESFTALTGAVFAAPSLGPGPPLVFGARPASGESDGGETVELAGFRLTGTPTVTFDGAQATAVTVLSPTTASATTPAGEDLHGNPRGLVALQVSDEKGSSPPVRGYVFEPGLFEVAPAEVGDTLELQLLGPADATAFLFFGGNVPGLGIPIPGVEGSLEVLLNLQFVEPALFTTTGDLRYSLPVPDKPGLVGAVVPFQAAFVTSLVPLAGGFSNRLDVTLRP